jgi:hypothetical protein
MQGYAYRCTRLESIISLLLFFFGLDVTCMVGWSTDIVDPFVVRQTLRIDSVALDGHALIAC